jgi:hypothetical protein
MKLEVNKLPKIYRIGLFEAATNLSFYLYGVSLRALR